METRKLQTIGGGASFGVCLPKQWVEARGLKAGDEVMLESRPTGELFLQARGNRPVPPHEREVELKSRDSDEVLRTLIALYVSGFDTAVVNHSGSDPPAIQTGVGEACARLHGVQVLDDGPGRLVLQDLSDATDFSIDRGLRRMQVLVLHMLNNVTRLISGGGDSVLRESERAESELDRLILLLLKQYTACLQRTEFPTPALTSAVGGLHAMFVAQFLERIGDYVLRISAFSHFLSMDPSAPVTEAVKASLSELHSIVADAIKAFNARDTKLANEVIKRSLAFTPTSGRDSLFDAFTSPRTKPQLYSCVRCIKFFTLLECVERIALYAKSIGETAINWAMVDMPERTV